MINIVSWFFHTHVPNNVCNAYNALHTMHAIYIAIQPELVDGVFYSAKF